MQDNQSNELKSMKYACLGTYALTNSVKYELKIYKK